MGIEQHNRIVAGYLTNISGGVIGLISMVGRNPWISPTERESGISVYVSYTIKMLRLNAWITGHQY